jgi:hypothetical protein
VIIEHVADLALLRFTLAARCVLIADGQRL